MTMVVRDQSTVAVIQKLCENVQQNDSSIKYYDAIEFQPLKSTYHSMSDPPDPLSIWQLLSEEDRLEYIRLRAAFQQNPKISSKDRRVTAFPRELQRVLRYIDRSPDNMEARCIIAGLCFVCPVVCVNTRSFHRKAKVRSWAIAALPGLECNPNLLRQWTCRVVSASAQVCFASAFGEVALAEITEEALLDETRPKRLQRFAPAQPIQTGLSRQPRKKGRFRPCENWPEPPISSALLSIESSPNRSGSYDVFSPGAAPSVRGSEGEPC
jgi:hypothetical protein